MTASAGALENRIVEGFDTAVSTVPLVVGACGSGRTALLLRLRDRLGPSRCQYVDVQRVATTPERFHHALLAASPFAVEGVTVNGHQDSPRAAFDATIQFLQASHASDGTPATFLLDEVLEFRTFESFPGLRSAVADLIAAIGDSPNRFVLTTRFRTRASRLVANGPRRLRLDAMPPIATSDVEGLLAEAFAGTRGPAPDEETARSLAALSNGHVGHAQMLATELQQMAQRGVADPLSALAALLSPGGRLDAACRYSYELRLHRARGYGALKAILDVLAAEEPLTLTAVAQRLHRTPGSTKDYLSWLEDVDLVQVSRKQYRFADPLLRVWVRLNGRPTPPAENDVAREVHRYATERLATPSGQEPVAAAALRATAAGDIIEFD
jgi:hypothetical protein